MDELIARIQAALSPDLLKPGYEHAHPLGGHCYVASEALWHLTGCVLHVYRARDPQGITHWWLQDGDKIIDPTAAQYTTPPYEQGRRAGFLTKNPSRRARILMEKL